ncbi:kinase-like domain-containing protein [Schizophyllum commune]
MSVAIENCIAVGGFGKVYRARVTSEPAGGLVAVKKSRMTCYASMVKNPMLRHEATSKHTRSVYAWGCSKYYEYMVLELLGELVDAPLLTDEGLTLRNLVVLAWQMTDALEHVHAHHLVHCDIKPDSFLFNLDPAAGQIKLIDFGLARPYRNPDTLQHIPPSTIPCVFGTKHYTSINVQYHHGLCLSPSRRDDMESLAYTIVDLLCDDLPWGDPECPASEILALKQSWPGPAICAGYPAVFGEFVDYTRSLAFEETPDHAGWKHRFLAICPQIRGRPRYDASDREPKVGEPLWSDNVEIKSVHPKPTSLAQPERSRLHAPVWQPESTWADTEEIDDKDLLGEEQRTVRERLQRLEEPPACHWVVPG